MTSVLEVINAQNRLNFKASHPPNIAFIEAQEARKDLLNLLNQVARAPESVEEG